MIRLLIAAVLGAFASQAVDTFRVAKSPVADVRQDTLEAVNPESTRTTEVFPGAFESRYGALVMRRVRDLISRVSEADREMLVKQKLGAGVDRAIVRWRANAAGRTVALAVHYYRAGVAQLKVEMSDDYGRAEPIFPADYEFHIVAVCSRAGEGWTCDEEPLDAFAQKHSVEVPNTPAGRDAAVEKLLAMVIAERK